MFRTLVSSLSLSPSAVSQLAFYARRLKQEKVSRLFSVLAAVLVVGLQFATILAPPSPSNAASPSDLVHGGIVSKTDLLNRYDASSELKAIYNYFGISRADIAATKEVTINTKDKTLQSMGRQPHTSTDGVMTIAGVKYYYRPMYKADTGSFVTTGSSYKVLQGYSSLNHRYFAVMFLCGNLVFKVVPPLPTPTPAPAPKAPTPIPVPKAPTPIPVPKAIPSLACISLTGNTSGGEAPLTVEYAAVASSSNQTVSSYIYDFGDNSTQTTSAASTSHVYGKVGTFKATLQVKGSLGTTTPISSVCSFTLTTTSKPAQIIQAKSALNETQNADAQSQPAQAGDAIKYTLVAKNIGGSSINFVITDDITDILEYADATDTGGGTSTDRSITWPSVSIAAGASVTRTFTIRVKSPVPTTPVGTSDKYSFDLRMDNVYGNVVQVQVQPPVPKQIEQAVNNLPQTGGGSTTFIVIIIATMAFFFYLRNRQLMAEVKILRHDYQGGA